MKLSDIVFKEFFAIVEFLGKKYIPENNRIVIESALFHEFIDTNLYLPRNEKLGIYKDLGLIICNSKGITSVVYDKELKKSTRKVVINYGLYKTLKKLYDTDFTV